MNPNRHGGDEVSTSLHLFNFVEFRSNAQINNAIVR